MGSTRRSSGRRSGGSSAGGSVQEEIKSAVEDMAVDEEREDEIMHDATEVQEDNNNEEVPVTESAGEKNDADIEMQEVRSPASPQEEANDVGEDTLSKTDIRNWHIRLQEGGAETTTEIQSLVDEIKTKLTNHKSVKEKAIDTNSKRQQEEYWAQAEKKVLAVLEFHEEYDREVNAIKELKNSLDDEIADSNSITLELHRRRLYFQEHNTSDNKEYIADEDYGPEFSTTSPIDENLKESALQTANETYLTNILQSSIQQAAAATARRKALLLSYHDAAPEVKNEEEHTDAYTKKEGDENNDAATHSHPPEPAVEASAGTTEMQVEPTATSAASS
mmetsp:Transcript_19291/g.25039  ORF Transcript_19291/g.25039 Transcript_19291/m.25039 type:complete len:334 (-) Transcript_19291:842-1843(-)|eukprot:CAMPEP_0197289872 /NCGR_PEP_ID=MMETSP0890-20130614/7130_1 /TAXON_ID=44058 ORGANISM="Aureoumbra lagunensis, Strain CCMP1510" /NCGR_SAMPLE_ID=MMETSP0890 /ASSEMBLY_ACC=CAM_ASM_000533 /LENGTH=333 /DNA_ID=CAMNT_0042761545 /DNA_START=839 /DNA_END=1840 /DNA_ORIENTATION=+